VPKVSQLVNSFNGGELAPEFHGRTDTKKYNSGAASIENFVVHPEGGLHRRSGTRFVDAAFDSSKKSRMIPFIFSTTQAYMLEFSEYVIRVFADEVRVDVDDHEFLPAVVDTTAEEINIADHGYVHNQGPFRLTNAGGGLPAGLAIDTDYFMSMPQAKTYTAADVVAGAGGTITFSTAHNYSPQQGPFRMTAAGGMMVGHPQAITDYYVIVSSPTAIQISATAGGGALSLSVPQDDGTGVYTFAPTGDYLRDKFALAIAVDGAPIDITGQGTGTHTITPNPLGTPTGLPLEIPTPYAESELYEIQYVQSADFLFIDHKDHRPAQLTRAGNTKWALDFTNILDGAFTEPENADTSSPMLFSATATTGVTAFAFNAGVVLTVEDIGRILRIRHSAQIGVAEIVGIDTNLGPPFRFGSMNVISDLASTGATSTWRMGAWHTGNWPSSLSFFEQRLAHGGEAATPQTLHGSNTSAFNLFAPSEVDEEVLATNAVNFTIAINQVNAIRWMALHNRLIIATSNALFTARASFDGEPITPTNIQVQKISDIGALGISPVSINDELVYVTANSQSLRGFTLHRDSDTVSPVDITLLAKHIFGRTLIVQDMAYQQDRQSVLWVVRGDGVLAAVTYVPDQEVFGWHRHIVGGNFGSGTATTFAAATIDADEDTITFTLEHGWRTGQGPFTLTTDDTLPTGTAVNTNYYVRVVDVNTVKLTTMPDPDGAVIDMTDAGVGTHTITESGAAVVESVAVIPAPNATHDQVWMSVKRTIGGSTARHIEFFEDEWLSGTDTEMRYVDSAPVAYSGGAVSSISGLDHLEGETVQILAGGAVHPSRVVSSGAVTLTGSFTDVLVGLRYISELETLRFEPPDPEGSSMGKMARTDHVVLRLFETIGGEIGPDIDSMLPLVLRAPGAPMDESTAALTGDHKVAVSGAFQREKRLFIRQNQPLPLNLLSMNIMSSTGQR